MPKSFGTNRACNRHALEFIGARSRLAAPSLMTLTSPGATALILQLLQALRFSVPTGFVLDEVTPTLASSRNRPQPPVLELQKIRADLTQGPCSSHVGSLIFLKSPHHQPHPHSLPKPL